jgi:hypothetical protein
MRKRERKTRERKRKREEEKERGRERERERGRRSVQHLAFVFVDHLVPSAEGTEFFSSFFQHDDVASVEHLCSPTQPNHPSQQKQSFFFFIKILPFQSKAFPQLLSRLRPSISPLVFPKLFKSSTVGMPNDSYFQKYF